MHKLSIEDIEELIKLYEGLELKGKKVLAKVNSEKEYTLNSLATIELNSLTLSKERVLLQEGKKVVAENVS